MAKIPKNRQDGEMFANVKEKFSFENESDGLAEQPVTKPAKKEPAKPGYAEFITPELQEDLGKALLALKVNLYKQGIVDYKIKLATEAGQIVLKAVPVTKKAK